jgi:hypothetical protein
VCGYISSLWIAYNKKKVLVKVVALLTFSIFKELHKNITPARTEMKEVEN